MTLFMFAGFIALYALPTFLLFLVLAHVWAANQKLDALLCGGARLHALTTRLRDARLPLAAAIAQQTRPTDGPAQPK